MNNLDEILKQQMQDFAPDAPNVWAGIEQVVQSNAAIQSSAATGKVVLSKLAITAIKVAVVLVVSVSVATYFYTKSNEIEKTENVAKVSKAQEPSVIILPNTSSNKGLETNKPKETFITDKKDIKSNSIIITKEFASPNNKAENKEIVGAKQQEALNNNHLEKSIVPINSNVSFSNPVIPEIDLSEKIDSIENMENNVETTEINKNTSALIKIPNVLTPNNDGINDRYVVEIEDEKLFNLKIYNFNNELVFESTDKSFTWDGINQRTGQACNSGIYFGVLNFKFINNDKLLTKMTKIKLIR